MGVVVDRCLYLLFAMVLNVSFSIVIGVILRLNFERKMVLKVSDFGNLEGYSVI